MRPLSAQTLRSPLMARTQTHHECPADGFLAPTEGGIPLNAMGTAQPRPHWDGKLHPSVGILVADVVGMWPTLTLIITSNS